MPDYEHIPTPSQPRLLPVYISLGFTAYFGFLIAYNHFALEFVAVDIINELITLPLLIGTGLYLLMNLWWLVRGGPSGRMIYSFSVVALLVCLAMVFSAVL
jgi:ABC-type tungstate transport system substrate-binding protein